jgi:hypothetical protein
MPSENEVHPKQLEYERRVKAPEGYKESTAPILFKFEKLGDTLEGLLVAFKRDTVKGDEVFEVYVVGARGDYKTWASYDLKQKLRKSMLNKRVIIRYVADDDSTAAKGNSMKIFKVWYRDPEASDGSIITDDDIPF